jgi:cyclophilin family peptidyl-prolyl cis-trans isomerase
MKMPFIVIGILILVGIGSWMILGSSNPNSANSVTTRQSDQSNEMRSPTENPANKVGEKPMYTKAPEMTIDTKKTYTARLITSKGPMAITLYGTDAPVTVNNFVFLAREKFYDDTVFHRIIKDFMVQGGDPTGTGMGSPGYRFNDEPITREYTRGTIAMANSGPNTNGSQFFIMHADYQLPKSYVIFGSIAPGDTESLKTLDAIASVPVTNSPSGEPSQPQEPVTLKSVAIEEQ